MSQGEEYISDIMTDVILDELWQLLYCVQGEYIESKELSSGRSEHHRFCHQALWSLKIQQMLSSYADYLTQYLDNPTCTLYKHCLTKLKLLRQLTREKRWPFGKVFDISGEIPLCHHGKPQSGRGKDEGDSGLRREIDASLQKEA